MTKLRTLLADGEPIGRKRLQRLIEDFPGIEVVAECTDGLATLEAARNEAPDLMLLDIQMPGSESVAAARSEKPGRLPLIIVIMAPGQEAVKSFDAVAADFLVRPLNRERLWKALVRARHLKSAALLSERAESAPVENEARGLTVRSGATSHFISFHEIDWVEASGKCAILHTGCSTHLLHETMSELERQFPEPAFLRVSRSAMVNVTRIREIDRSAPKPAFVILVDGSRVDVTCSFRDLSAQILASANQSSSV